MKKKNSHLKFSLLLSAVIWLAATVTTPAFADNAVKLKILVLTTGDVTEDAGLCLHQTRPRGNGRAIRCIKLRHAGS